VRRGDRNRATPTDVWSTVGRQPRTIIRSELGWRWVDSFEYKLFKDEGEARWAWVASG